MTWMKYNGAILKIDGAIAVAEECCCDATPCCNIEELSGTGATFQLEIIESTGDCAVSWPVGSTAVMTEFGPSIWTNQMTETSPTDPLVDAPSGHGFYILGCGTESNTLELLAVDCPSTSEEARNGELLSVQCEPTFEAVYRYTIEGSDLVCLCDEGGGTVTIKVTRLT